MIKLIKLLMALGLVLSVSGSQVWAQPDAGADPVESQTEAEPADLEELQRQVDVLAEEVERLRSGEDESLALTDEEIRALGLAPSAARTYQTDRGVSIAGYGEMLIENYDGKTNKADMLRAIIYAGYRFNDKFLFNSEIEFEHAKEAYVEFAYVDYLVHKNLGLRGGLLLVPMGLVNEYHEPTVYLGAERPVTEQAIIPSTWRENGFGLHGSAGMVSYRAYVVNGFNGSKFSSGGLRGGRQKGAKAKADNFAFTGRLDITPTPGVFFGGSFYTGGSGQGDIEVDGRNYGVKTTIVDAHLQAQARGWDFRALYAKASLGDVWALNQVLGKTGSSAVGEGMQGGYVQLGYDVLSQSSALGGTQITPYFRLENVDTQASMQSGHSRSLSTDNTFKTFGIEIKPISNIVLKGDYMWVDNAAGSGTNQFNINLGYVF